MVFIQNKIKHPENLIIILFFLGIIIRLIYVCIFLDPHNYTFEDTGLYYSAAKQLVKEGHFWIYANEIGEIYSREPLFPIFLAPFVLILPGNFLIIRLFLLLIVSFAVFPFYRICRHFVNHRLSILGCLLFMFYPYYIFLSGFLYPEGLVLIMLIFLVYYILNYVSSKKHIDFLKIILTLYLLYFCKVTTLSLLPLLMIPLVALGISKKALILSFVGICTFFVLNVPWTVRNFIVYQDVSLLTRIGDVDLQENEEFTSDDHKSLFAKTFNSFKFIPKNSIDYFNPGISNIATDTHLKNWKYKLISYMSVIPLLTSLLVILFRRDQKTIILYAVYFLYAFPFLILFGQTRYRIPSDFILMIFLIILFEGVRLKFFSMKLRFSGAFPFVRR